MGGDVQRNAQRSSRHCTPPARAGAIVALVAGLGACNPDPPTGPHAPHPEGVRPRSLDVATIALPVPSTNAAPAYGEQRMAKIDQQLLSGENVRVRVRGWLTAQYTTQCYPNSSPQNVSPTGIGSGTFGVEASTSDSTVTPVVGGGPGGWVADPGGDGWIDYMRNDHFDRSEYVWAGRGGSHEECEAGGGGSGNWVPAWTLSSTQTVSVEPVTFKVTPSTLEFQPGDVVHFTLAVANVTPSNLKWTFIYAPYYQSGGLTLPQCDGQLACDAAPTSSGVMEVHADVVGGTLQTHSERVVNIVQCPKPDEPLLQSKAIRDSLRALLLASKPDTVPDTLRRERAAHILEDRTTHELIFRRSNPDPSGTNCSVLNDFTLDAAKYILRATVHTHPYSLLDFVAYCGSVKKNVPYMPVGSTPDWNSLNATDSTVKAFQPTVRVRELIIDKNSVIGLKLEDGSTTVYLHSRRGCEWWP